MTAADWARSYHADLLTQLETEANEGWAELEPAPSTRQAWLELTLCRLLQTLLDAFDEEAQLSTGGCG